MFGGQGAGSPDFISMLLPVALIALFYFMILRPQQARMKAHQAMIAGVKRGDTVVLSSGIIGKVTSVGDVEVNIDIATGVNVKVVKSTLSEVRARGEPAVANDPIVTDDKPAPRPRAPKAPAPKTKS